MHNKELLIAELAEHSTIIIQNSSSNPSSWKNLDVQPYNCTTVQGATFNMCGQLYCGHANVTPLFSSPVVRALGSKLDDLGSSPGWGKVLCPWGVQGKKMQALLLGLAKSIYWSDIAHFYFLLGLFFPYLFLTKLVETNSWTSILVSATTFYPLRFQVTDVTSYRIILLL